MPIGAEDQTALSAVEGLATTVRHVAHASKAEDHHGPGRWLGDSSNGSIDKRDVIQPVRIGSTLIFRWNSKPSDVGQDQLQVLL